MKLGLNVPNFGPTADPQNLLDWARFGESHGFGLAVMSDHVLPTPDVTELYPAPFYDPFVTLSWLAGQTERIELGTSTAILPYRHPLYTARLAAAIDRFSGGRFVFGVGVGLAEDEFAALGLDFGARGAMSDEYLAAIHAAWAEDVVTVQGPHLDARDVATGPAPVRSPHPPIWVGGASAPAIRRAVRYGDAWHPPNPDVGWLRDTGLPALRAAADAAARPVPALAPRIRARLTDRDVPPSRRRVGEGSLPQVLDDLAELADLGAGHVVLDTNPDHPRDRRPAERDWETLARIAERVGAHVRPRAAR